MLARASVVARSAVSSSWRADERSIGSGATGAPTRTSSVGVAAVAGLGRHASGGGVGMVQHPALLELRELGAYRRRRGVDETRTHERVRPDRLAALDVRLDDEAQEQLLAGGERACDLVVHCAAFTP